MICELLTLEIYVSYCYLLFGLPTLGFPNTRMSPKQLQLKQKLNEIVDFNQLSAKIAFDSATIGLSILAQNMSIHNCLENWSLYRLKIEWKGTSRHINFHQFSFFFFFLKRCLEQKLLLHSPIVNQLMCIKFLSCCMSPISIYICFFPSFLCVLNISIPMPNTGAIPLIVLSINSHCTSIDSTLSHR